MDKDLPSLPTVPSFSEEPRVDPKYFGDVISFYLNGTALCFVNTKRRDSPFKIAGKGDEVSYHSLSTVRKNHELISCLQTLLGSRHRYALVSSCILDG